MSPMRPETLPEHLGYFVEWGGRAWENLVRYALDNFVGTDLSGLHVLDVGTRSGRMACLFALLGAQATGIDIKEETIPEARAEAEKWGVAHRTRFICYDGDPDVLPDAAFDIVFTKSLLVVLPDLDGFLSALERKLKPGGKAVFVENGKGSFPFPFLRRIRHRTWDYTKARFFTAKEIALIGSVFSLVEVRRTRIPPVFLVLGSKAGPSH